MKILKHHKLFFGLTIAGVVCLLGLAFMNICYASGENEPGTTPEEFMDTEATGDKDLKALFEKTSLIVIFEKGGLIMWPLLIASILAQGAVIERSVFLLGERRRRNPGELKQFFSAVSEGNIPRAIEIGNASHFYVVRALGYALSHKEKSLENALLFAQETELKRFRRGIPMLDTIITLAPLLGLLGTVTGMMGSFSMIGGELSAPGAITGGIAEALIATAFGLGIAITALIPFNLVNTKAEEARSEMESAATHLELLLHVPSNMSVRSPKPQLAVNKG